jgi:hypothetical protein
VTALSLANMSEKSNRNDVLSETDLRQRNDLLLFTPERCPAGPHLGREQFTRKRNIRGGSDSMPSSVKRRVTADRPTSL